MAIANHENRQKLCNFLILEHRTILLLLENLRFLRLRNSFQLTNLIHGIKMSGNNQEGRYNINY